MSLLKLISTVVFVLGAWMSVGVVKAQTNYNFNATFEDAETITAILTNIGTDPTIPFTSIGNLIVDTNQPFSQIYPVPALGSIYGYGNQFGVSGNYAYTNFIIYTYGYWNVYASNTLGALTGGTGIAYEYNTLQDAQTNDSTNANYLLNITSASFTVAPEMNASFIPQVGLLLGCLFFLVGRKKVNTDSMLTA